MKLIYLVNARIPTEKAYGWAISKTCEQLADLGIDVLLVLPKCKNRIKQDIFDYYNLKRNFKVIRIFNINLRNRFGFCHKLIFLLQNFSFLFASLFIKSQKDDLIYLRNIEQLLFWPWKNKNVFFEMHFLSRKDKFFLFLVNRAKKVIVVTHQLKNYLVNYGLAAEKILVAPDGVELKEFNLNQSQKECRDRLDLPLDKKIVLYAGHLYDWKGVQTLADAARLLEKDILVVFVGGTKYDIAKFKVKNSTIQNILIVGHKPHPEIPYWLKSADVLVLPNSGKEEISQYYTSPLKMFEYMAVQKPIVASNLPSIGEILNKDNAVLVQPDNPGDLARGIEKALKDSYLSAKIVKQAFKDVQKYSWLERTKNIIKFVRIK